MMQGDKSDPDVQSRDQVADLVDLGSEHSIRHDR
jgi:hypothetical protein